MIESDIITPVGAVIAKNMARVIACKRVLDFCTGTVLGILMLPIIILAVLAIKLVDPGSGFYIQERIGMHGRPFRFFKLRTMRLNGDAWLREYLAQDPPPKDPRIFRDARDPRILPVIGFWLRRYSIDEMPQIWNVIRGDLSLVGPRALPDYHCKLLSPEFVAFRCRVRPGITGLWQVEARSKADPSTIEIYDAKYLSNYSLGSDFRILCRTVLCVLRGTGI